MDENESLMRILRSWQVALLARVLAAVLDARYGAVKIIIIDGKISKIIGEISYEASKPVDIL